MGRILNLGLCFMLAVSLSSCERNRAVEAGNAPAGFQPTSVPQPGPSASAPAMNDEIMGELRRVDLNDKNVMIRVENGMEQTFKFNDDTSVTGLWVDKAKTQKTDGDNTARLKQLAGKPGSEVSIRWRDENGQKMAISIDVTHVTTKKRSR